MLSWVSPFNSQEFSQIHGLAMGSLLSPVAACLYMEMMEKDHFLNIMGADVVWHKYIDDMLTLAPAGGVDFNPPPPEVFRR